MLSLLTNPISMQALQARAGTVRELAEVRARLATGLRVASAKDETAAYTISRAIRSDVAGWGAVLDSLMRGQATVSVASTGVRAMSEVLMQVREHVLALSAASGEDEKTQLRRQIQTLVSQSDAIAERSSYQGMNLLNGRIVPPAPPSQPADFLLPFPTSPASGELTFTLNAGAFAGRVLLELDLGANLSEVEIYQGTKRRAATGKDINSGGPPKPESGVQVIGFDYDPAQGQTLSFRFNDNYVGSNAWSIASLRMVYPPPPPGVEIGTSVLSSPQQDAVALDRWSLLSGGLQLRDLTTEPSADALAKIEAAIQTVHAAGAYFGGLENQLERRHDSAVKLRSGLEAQIGALVDADIARESARLTALLTREQLGNTSLRIANASPRILLDLFQQSARGSTFGTA